MANKNKKNSRDYDIKKYMMVFLLTLSIFSIGLFLGSLMDNERTKYFLSYNEVQKQNVRSMQLQFELNNLNIGANQCAKTKSLFDYYLIELEQNRERLNTYVNEAKVTKKDFTILKRDYVLSQLNFWMLTEDMKVNCPNNSNFTTVIYFYSSKEKCPTCSDQGFSLDYYKVKLKTNLLIFAIDEEFASEEPIIQILKDVYEIGKYPALIINGEKYEELVDRDQLQKIFCGLDSTKGLIDCATE